MQLDQVIATLSCKTAALPAKDSESMVPKNKSGLYSIFIDDTSELPEPFRNILKFKDTSLIYIGRASSSLNKRLVLQDLRRPNSSTFFRGIGAVLGFTPQIGSLIGRRNQNNYFFSNSDTSSIIEWIDEHLYVKWIVLSQTEIRLFEPACIRQLRPILNTVYNPDAIQELASLREKCRKIAQQI